MNSKNYTFNIVTPTKNVSNLVKGLIKSLLIQNYPNWNLLLVDNSSENSHLKKTKELTLIDKRIHFLKQDNNIYKGIYGAMNMGARFFTKKKNSWILFLGADDCIANRNIFQDINLYLNEYFNSFEMIDLLIADSKYFLNGIIVRDNKYMVKNRTLNSFLFTSNLFIGKTPVHQSTFFNPSLFFNKYYYDDKYQIAADLDFFLRISKVKNLKIAYLRKYIVNISAGGISSQKNFLRLKEVFKSYLKRFKALAIIPFLSRYCRKFLLIKL